MAENKFYLRPSADILVEHTMYPAESTAAYLLLNEEVNDSTTYISEKGVAGETVVQTSSFKMSCDNIPNDAKEILDVKVYVQYGQIGQVWKIAANVNGNTFDLTTNTISTIESDIVCYSSQSFTDSIKIHNNSISDIDISLTSTKTVESGTKIIIDVRVSQLYIEITYGNGISRKVNGEWKKSYSIYEKINNVWEKIENDYEPLQSFLVKGGHHQKKLDYVKETCTENGLTEGYACSICGKIFVPQEIIQGSHKYMLSGGHDVCTECGDVKGIGQVELINCGTITDLSVARGYLSATTVGDYALFGGGRISSIDYISTVGAFKIQPLQ